MTERATARLRTLLAGEMIVAPGVFDALSARLAQLAGFSAVHLTGLGVEASQLAAPDLGLMTLAELAQHAARVTAALDVPVVADVDTGFGGVLNVQRTIREMERAGVAGVHIEDQPLPKHCPLLSGRKVIPRGEALDRVKAALDARTDADFVIVARSDGDVVSFDELVERCNLYLAAGADMVMPMLMKVEGQSLFSLAPDEQMTWHRRLVGAIEGPVMGMGAGAPRGFTHRDLAAAGYRLIMYSADALGAAANAMAQLFAEIARTGATSGYTDAHPGPYTDPLELMRAARLDDFVAAEQRFSASLTT